jgi:tetratricopeptide (TPR) repeat protein
VILSSKKDIHRRDFLVACRQAAGAVFVPAAVHPLARASRVSSGADASYHLRPRYREQTPLEAVLKKRAAGLDNFVTEKYHDQLAVILDQWRANLLQHSDRTHAIEQVVAADFQGSSLKPSESRLLRTKAALEVRRLNFADERPIGREAFANELQEYLTDLPQILTSEFQITRIEEIAANRLVTAVRYELVGTGEGFFREQRVGQLQLTWHEASPGHFRLEQWQAIDETRSRSTSLIFSDVTRRALGHNSSYSAQLLHGVDFWRTVLDGACGIDIYGHNGVSVGDIDGDGFDDLYVCQPAGLPNRLYRNRGDGTFEDVTETSGLGVLENTACALFADFDNDGHQDLIVVRANGPLLFQNQHNGTFKQKPDAFQFANSPQGTFTGAAAADYDRDGWLDIYFCLYVYYQGTDQYRYPTPYYDANNGPPNFLMRNNRDGTFRDATAESGLNENNTRYSFCCSWTDLNNDGWPDLYVVNDFGRKNLYRNNGNGTFSEIATQAGVDDVGAGMSICCFDYNNDGAEDLYVADMWTAAGERITTEKNFHEKSTTQVRALYHKHAMGNSLFRNESNGHFQDETRAAGVNIGRWAWSSDSWDFDHDGFPDLYIANGMVSGPIPEDLNSFFWRQVVANSSDESKPAHDYEQGWAAVNELLREDFTWSGYERNVFYANNGNGTFSDVSGAVGLDFVEDGRAFALADFDCDGRLEMILKSRNAPQLRLLKNVIKELPPSISFCLRGTKSNRDAIGAAITIKTDLGQQTKRLQAGSGFISQHTKEIFFGLGEARGTVKAVIRWPSGSVQTLEGLHANHRVYVEEENPSCRTEPFLHSLHESGETAAQSPENLPSSVETWLLAPVSVPDLSLPGIDGISRTLSKFRSKPLLLYLWTRESPCCQQNLISLQSVYARGYQLIAIHFGVSQDLNKVRALARDHSLLFPILMASDDAAAVYNILYRQLFDRHRDLSLPTSLLLNEYGEIVKVYQGPLNLDQLRDDFQRIPKSEAARVARALPFAGSSSTFTFGRNYLSLGSTYFQRGYIEEAGDSFRSALQDNPSSAEAHYGLGSVYLRQSKQDDARASFEQAVRLNASYPDTKANAWNNLGLLATQEGQTPQAIGFFQRALQLNPDHLISLQNLGNAYRQQKRWNEAQSTLEKALAVGPDDPEVNYSLGMVFAQVDQPYRAYTYLQRALQLRPDYPEAMNNLGVLYLRTHRRDEAVAEFNACIRVAPDFDQSYLNLARVYEIEGNREQARATLEALLSRHPNHLKAQEMLGRLK